jgi:hypothetical protein
MLALTMTAAAADVNGKWSGSFTVTGPDGSAGDSNPAFLILKQSGATLTGTAGGDEAEQFPIENAKIENNKITGTVNPSDGATYTVTLTVDGDRMTGEVTVTQGGESEKCKVELKRER